MPPAVPARPLSGLGRTGRDRPRRRWIGKMLIMGCATYCLHRLASLCVARFCCERPAQWSKQAFAELGLPLSCNCFDAPGGVSLRWQSSVSYPQTPAAHTWTRRARWRRAYHGLNDAFLPQMLSARAPDNQVWRVSRTQLNKSHVFRAHVVVLHTALDQCMQAHSSMHTPRATVYQGLHEPDQPDTVARRLNCRRLVGNTHGRCHFFSSCSFFSNCPARRHTQHVKKCQSLGHMPVAAVDIGLRGGALGSAARAWQLSDRPLSKGREQAGRSAPNSQNHSPGNPLTCSTSGLSPISALLLSFQRLSFHISPVHRVTPSLLALRGTNASPDCRGRPSLSSSSPTACGMLPATALSPPSAPFRLGQARPWSSTGDL
ncbi:hypothetical protein BS50DRAFT_142141 [Corynespora cassiicola Philippines]|uniref:Uncharacterized protein n=1 Tax=Corynespora cassiicola Philippines TaxID=1448308 RepID=A0A2T2NA14_CORCC|nr:hypothetical protein BS50DRAFT_142141 [Corynespora cassiicola Philippines]